MKTKEQIIDYINSQPWKNAFYENAFKSRLIPSYDEYTISDSFCWAIFLYISINIVIFAPIF